MLSVSSIGSAGGAAEYYGKDDYYVTGEADAPGVEWKGKGSEQAGLRGTATAGQFRDVLQGRHAALADPDRPTKPDEKHRPGWDLTFSAPKSVSLAVMLGGDQRLLTAHRAAVDRAMAYAEKHFAITRVRDQGKIREVQTGNLVYASTEHSTSRKGDPQLHTHNIIANATWDSQGGKFRALETLSLFRHRQLVGRIYQAELAKSAINLGYDVTRDRAKGTFELAAYSRSKVLAFSKRHRDIQEAASLARSEKGELSGAQRDALALKDRPKKLDVPRSELQARWTKESKSVGLDNAAIVAKASSRSEPGRDVTPTRTGVARNPIVVFAQALAAIGGRVGGNDRGDPYGQTEAARSRDLEARTATSFGLRVMEQGKAVFTQHEVVAKALEIAKAGMTVDRVLGELSGLQADGRLLQADRTLREGLTTKAAVDLERGLVTAIEAGKGQAAPLMSPDAAASHLGRLHAEAGEGGIRLNEGQTAAAALLLTSPDRYVGIQGFAGVGKTTMFRVVKEAAEKAGTTLSGLAPTHQAAEAMREGAGIPAQTIEQWLNRTEAALAAGGDEAEKHKATWKDRTVLVDESSMQSNAQADRLMKASEALGLARMIYIGDERQLGSPEAGAPWRLALGSGLEHARMTQIIRQRDPVLLAAVERMAKGEISGAIQGLGDRVVAVGKDALDKDLAGAAVDAWRAYTAARGVMPAVIVPTNALRAEVGQLIRSELIAGGKLGEGQTVPTLRQVRMSTAEAGLAASYREGQVLVFHTAERRAQIPRGAQLTVVGRDEARNTLVLDDGRGGKRVLDLTPSRADGRQAHDAYRNADLEVRSGDRLVWDKMDRDLGVRVGEGFTVERIAKDGWTIRTATGEEKTVAASSPMLRFVSHGYAETADRSQGSTYKDVVAVLSSRHGEAATEARAYVQMSRAAENLTFVTNDPKLLAMKLNKQDGLNAIASHELADVVADLASKDQLASLAKDGLDGATTAKDQDGRDQLASAAKDGLDGSAPDGDPATGPASTGKVDEKPFEKSHEPAPAAPAHSL